MYHKLLFRPGLFGRWSWINVKIDADWDSFFFFSPAWPWVKWTDSGLAPPENTRNVHEYEPNRQQQQRYILNFKLRMIAFLYCSDGSGFCEAEKGQLVSLLYLWCLLLKCGYYCQIVTLYTKTVKRGAVILTNHLFLFRDALRPLFWMITTNLSDLSGYYRYYWRCLMVPYQDWSLVHSFFLFNLHYMRHTILSL